MVNTQKAKKQVTPEMLGYLGNATGGGLDSMFDGQMDDPNKHLKELLTTEGDVTGKTDISVKHIRALIKLKYTAYSLGSTDKDGKIVPDNTLMTIFNDFLKLRISKDRKSRGEFLQGIQGSSPMNRQEGMFNRLGSWFGNR